MSITTSKSRSKPLNPIKLDSTSKYQRIRVLDVEDTHKAAKTLLKSFRDDALAKLLVSHIEDQDEKDRLELTLYEAYVKQHILKGIVLAINETEDEFETVGVWSSPDSLEKGLDSFTNFMEAGYGKVWDMNNDEGRQKIFYGMLPLLHDTCERILGTDSRFKDKNIFTLVYLGSLESARGKGNVRLMFDYMFEKHIDNTPNSISYLESSSKTNIPIYEKFGFKFYEDIMLGCKESDDSIEGKDYAIMNVMIRGSSGHDWTKDENTGTANSQAKL